MDQKNKKQSIVGSRQLAVSTMVVVALLAPCILSAESVASKNNEGNRLFAKGRYEESEKAYLDAQVKNPGKPEVLYNLGNSLIKQKKFPQGIQSLRQSIDKGNKETQENSWYNIGNALYTMGNFKESSDAYIQALKLNPADGDAKHNLELALLKLQQQKQKQAGANQKSGNPDKSQQNQSSSGKENQQKQDRQDASGDRNAPSQRQQSPAPQEARRESTISKEQANQILDAVQNQELEQQRKLLESRARQKTNAKDW